MRLHYPLVAALLAAPLLTLPAHAAAGLTVRAGTTPETALFPSDRFTAADSRQLTGRRVNLPLPACTAATSSVCDGVRLLNTLDGFDTQPRVTVPLTGTPDIRTVTPATVYVQGPDGRVGLQQLVWDPASKTLAGTTRDQLREATAYRLVVTTGVLDSTGRHLGAGAATTFTTRTSSTTLDQLRRALDDGSAYSQTGISSRAPSFRQGSTSTVFPVVQGETIVRGDQVQADPSKPLVSSMVQSSALAGVACYAFGSFQSPQFVTADAVIPPVPSRQTPAAQGKATVGFALVVPAGQPPAGGWPVAVYGPGFTRSYFDVFLTADANAAAGIATLSVDPLGHGFGPASTISVGSPNATIPVPTTTFLSYGRGSDRDGNGVIHESEGVQPTDHKTVVGGNVVKDEPSTNALVGNRDGLIQTTVDNMAAVRLVESGVTVPGCSGQAVPLAKTNVSYYGLSFGGIYGTMLLGTDPHVRRGLLNVPGGPIADIARTGGFRNLLADQLRVSHPNLLNGGPGRDGFTEDIPQPFGAPVTSPRPGAFLLQDYLAKANWLERSGSPETFAPLLRLRPRYGAKEVLFQTAFGDNTVPNPTAGNIYRAGKLFDRVTYYRNDLTPSSGMNPHGFLEDPRLAGRQNGQLQLTTFLRTGTTIDPDGPLPVFEVPIADPDQTQCLHYPDPQTGAAAFPPGASGDCGHRPADAAP